MPSRLDRGGSLGGLRRGASYGFGEGSSSNPSFIFSASAIGLAMNPVPNLAPATVVAISFPILFATQHVYAHFDCEVDSEAVPAGNGVTFTMRLDGVTTAADTREQSVLVGSEGTVVPMHSFYVALAPGLHTVDVQAQATAANSYIIPASRSRVTIIVLPG